MLEGPYPPDFETFRSDISIRRPLVPVQRSDFLPTIVDPNQPGLTLEEIVDLMKVVFAVTDLEDPPAES